MLRKHFGAVALTLSLALLTGCPVASDLAGVDFDAPDNLGGDTGFPAPGSGFEQQLQTRYPGCDEPVDVEQARTTILDLVNQARAGEGIAPLVHSDLLERQASAYACEMIDGEFFGHVSPISGSTLSTRANSFGYDYMIVGENLAGGQPTPEQAFADWMESPSHRANILDPRFTELGIGIRVGGLYGIYYVQEFGHPRE